MAKKTFEDLAAETMSPEAIRRSDERSREHLAEMLLGEMREAEGFNQSDLADVLGIEPAALDAIEREGDAALSTLDAIVEALGGELVVTANFPRGRIEIKRFGKGRRREVARV